MNPVVVVTGAAGGIGSVTCDVLEEYGWDVVGLDTRASTWTGITVDLGDADALRAPSMRSNR